MKKILCLLLILSLCLPLLAACDNGTDPAASSTSAPQTTEPETPSVPDDPDFVYEIVDGIAIIYGYTGKGGDITIPASLGGCRIGEIVNFTFAQNDTITSVTFPGDVETTGDFAFYHCNNLKTVVLQEGVRVISRGCFSECPLLESVSVPSTVTEIGDVAFQGDKALTSLVMPEGLLTLGRRAFANSGITSVVIPSTVTTLGSGVFDFATSLKKADILCPIPELAGDMFASCFALEEVSLVEGIESIGEQFFFRCTSLKTLVFPSTLYDLESKSLYGCTSLETLYFKCPTRLRFHSYSFHWLPSLTDLYTANDAEVWETTKDKISKHNEEFDDDHIQIHLSWVPET